MAGNSKRRWWTRLLLFFCKWGIILGIIAGSLIAIYGALLAPTTPSSDELEAFYKHRSTIVTSADGEVIARYGRRGRNWKPLEEISSHVADALIATEDRRFYQHGGIDTKRTVAAAVFTLLGDRQGGSTITQQLVRNMYPESIADADPITRKLKEIITARKLEAIYTKKEILELYLNTVPFLYNAFGIEMAARTYFNKSSADLSLPESATLIGMLKGPARYNPVRHPERARSRRNVVLYQMVKYGNLPPDRYEALKDQALETSFRSHLLRDSIAPHLATYVRKKAERWASQNGYNLITDGLTIRTTLDAELQRWARRSVRRWGKTLQQVADVEWGRSSGQLLATDVEAYARYHGSVDPFRTFWETHPDLLTTFIRESSRFQNGISRGLAPATLMDSLQRHQPFMDSLRAAKTRLEVGFTAIEPSTGYVKAWVGSRDFLREQYDHVVSARRQPGSTFKPFVYAAALERGYSPRDSMADTPVAITRANGETWRPGNASRISGRNVTLRTALTESKNTVTARLTRDIGPSQVVHTARRLGIKQHSLRAVPSVGLGTSEVTLLEMVSAYATIADRGTHREPLVISQITDSTGQIVAEFGSSAQEALSDETARTLIDMMRGVIDEGTGRPVRQQYHLTADLIGKTGTTQHGADGWFIMAHPELAAGSWVGFNDPRVRFRSNYWGQGAHTGLNVVSDFFRETLDNRAINPSNRFPDPPHEGSEEKPAIAERVGRWIGSVANRIRSAFSGSDPPDIDAPDSESTSRNSDQSEEANSSSSDEPDNSSERPRTGW